MPTMWFAKDGKRPDTQQGEGVSISYEEIRGAFGGYQPRFFSNEPPEFNVDDPSWYPARVVIETQNADGVDEKFPRPGFYLIPDLTPHKAQGLLTAYRGGGARIV